MTSIAPLDQGSLPSTCVIEDEPVIRKVIKKSLRERDYPSAGYESAEAFLSQAPVAGPQLLVVDKNLPGISGLELVDRLRQQSTPFEAILITGYADQDSAIEAVRLGFYRYIRKPFDLDDLLTHVDGAARRLARRAAMDTEVDHAAALLAQHALLDQLAHQVNTSLDFVQNNISFLSQQLGSLGIGPTDQFRRLANALLEMGIGAGQLYKVGHTLDRATAMDPRHAASTDVQTLIEAQAVVAQDRTGFCGRIDANFGDDLPALSLNASLAGHVVLSALVELMHTANRLGQRCAPTVAINSRFGPGCLMVSLALQGEDERTFESAHGEDDDAQRGVVNEDNSSLDLTICRSLLVASGGELTGCWQHKDCVALSMALPAAAATSVS